jgi:hypothetical protein
MMNPPLFKDVGGYLLGSTPEAKQLLNGTYVHLLMEQTDISSPTNFFKALLGMPTRG